FRKIAEWWRQRERDGHVLILLGPAEEKETKEWRTVGETVTGLSLIQVAALLSRAELYLGNDSGVSHLAGAVGARGLVLFGPTQPQKWRPLGGSLSVVQNTAYRAVFPNSEGISLDEISVDEVIAGLVLLGG
ncbi:MAG: glycosyltransferase family 9 protein, partial [Candidatus Binatia bacterium]